MFGRGAASKLRTRVVLVHDLEMDQDFCLPTRNLFLLDSQDEVLYVEFDG